VCLSEKIPREIISKLFYNLSTMLLSLSRVSEKRDYFPRKISRRQMK
jgi:hypothetical protein